MKLADLAPRLPELRERLLRQGLVRLSGIESPEDPDLIGFAEAFSEASPGSPRLLAWDFGCVMKMRLDPDAANYLFSAEAVPLHWDGAFHREPRFLLFYCDAAEGEGGETVFVDTREVLDRTPEEVRERWQKVRLTYSTEKKAHYGGRFTTSLIREHPFTGEPVLRFAEVVETERNPVHLEIEGADPGSLYTEVAGRVLDPGHRVEHRWSPGDLLLVDNHAFLHGRNALGTNTGRSFRRVQIL